MGLNDLSKENMILERLNLSILNQTGFQHIFIFYSNRWQAPSINFKIAALFFFRFVEIA